METFNILYIDDNSGAEEDNCSSFITSLTKNNLIRIKDIKPNNLGGFIDEIATEYNDYDAFILDLRLNENQEGDEVANYLGQVLAQAIRTEQTTKDHRLNEFPIFLLTSDTKLQDYYKTDITSHDLFDHYYFKDKLAERGSDYEKQISDIIISYREIKKQDKDGRTLDLLLNCKVFEIDIFNLSIDTMTSISEISQFILKQIILKNGILINENILASRLGIDIEKSTDWDKLKSIIKEYGINYSGILSNGWYRWWGHRLVEWWEDNFPISLIGLEAEKRVDFLKDKFHLENLTPAEPIEEGLSSKFWTVCQAYNKPLDTSDGFLINKNYRLWQDKEYASFKSIIERESIKKGIKLHPSEKERYEELKSSYTKKIDL